MLAEHLCQTGGFLAKEMVMSKANSQLMRGFCPLSQFANLAKQSRHWPCAQRSFDPAVVTDPFPPSRSHPALLMAAPKNICIAND